LRVDPETSSGRNDELAQFNFLREIHEIPAGQARNDELAQFV